MRLAVTTSRDADEATSARARARAQKWGVPYLPRRRAAIEELVPKEADALVVFSLGHIELWDGEGHFRFTEGMAALRIGRLLTQVDQPDRVVVASELCAGDHVLDCTLGLAQDALVLARAVGPMGRVVGVEASLPVFAVVSEGLGLLPGDPGSARIEPVHADALDYLRAQPDRSFDVVFFDPMFDRPRRANAGFDVLRRYGDPSPLTQRHLQEARRVARRWVVVKAARHSAALASLGLTALPGSRYADVVFARL